MLKSVTYLFNCSTLLKLRKPPKRKGLPPLVGERPPFEEPRRFRKTVDELAHEYVKRLAAMGVEASREEVVTIVRGTAPRGMVTTVVEAWVNDERKRGVSIV